MLIIKIDHEKGDPRLSERDKQRLRESMPEIFPFLEEDACLTLLGIGSDGSSRWELKNQKKEPPVKEDSYDCASDPDPKSATVNFYVKITRGGGSGYAKKYDSRRKTQEISERAKEAGYMGIYRIGEASTHDECMRQSRGIFSPNPVSDWMIVEVQKWLYKWRTLDRIFRMLKGRSEPDQKALQEPLFATAGELAKRIQNNIHTIIPDRVDLELPSGATREEYERALQKEYDRSILDIFHRIYEYIPPHVNHPFINHHDEERILCLGKKLMRTWVGKKGRLVCVHGDLQSTNILTEYPPDPRDPVNLIDFSPRVHFCDARWDDGRFVADLLEYYLQAGDEKIRKFIDVFIHKSENLTGDSEYREGLCLGILSMTLIKLNPLGPRPIRDPDLARKYLMNSLRILEAGRFCWT